MQRLDYFGMDIPILLNGHRNHKTTFGSLLTIGMVIMLLIRIVYQINKVIQGNDPIILFQERQVVNPRRFDINPNTFNIALSIYDANYNYIADKSIFKVDSYLETKIPFENQETQKTEYKWTKIPFVLEKCTEDHFQIEDAKEYFHSTSLSQHYCLPKNLPLHIEGEFHSDFFSQIIITVKRCQGKNCKDDSVINEITKFFGVEVLFSDVYFSPENKEKPFKFYGRDLFWENSLKFPKKVFMQLRNNYVESDYGFFQSEIKTDVYPSFQQIDEKIVELTDEILSSFILRFEKKKENYYKRFYTKGLSIISELGGFSQVLIAFGIILTSFYTKIHLNQQLINDTFTFKQITESNTSPEQQEHIEIYNMKNRKASEPKLSKNSLKAFNIERENLKNTKNSKINLKSINSRNQKISNENLQPVIKNNNHQFSMNNQKILIDQSDNSCYPSQQEYLNKTHEQIQTTGLYKKSEIMQENKQQQQQVKKGEQISKNEKYKKVNSFKFNIIEIGVFKKKRAIFDYSIKQLYQTIDLQLIIDKLSEIDKLKKILLNNDQLILFEYLPKPSINYSFNKEKVNFHDNLSFLVNKKQKDDQEHIQIATDSYYRLQEEEKSINTRIFQYLDETYKKIFEQRMKIDEQLQISNKSIQDNTNLQNKQSSKDVFKQNNRNSISHSNEYYSNFELDSINIQDSIKKYSIFEPSPKFYHKQALELESKIE